MNSSNMTENSGNKTLPPDMTFGNAQIISISAYTPLFIVSAFFNLRVLRKLWRTKQRNGLSRLNQLLMHLVLADLSVTFLMMPLEIIWAMTVSWWAGDFMCRVCSFFRIFGLFLSSNIVVCISIDRFLAILKPFSVRGSSKRLKVMLITAWILAVVLSLPQMVVFHVESHPDFPWYEQCVTFGSFSSRLHEFLYFLMGMIFLYILPLLVILVTYGGIIFHLHKKSSPLTTCIKKTSAQDDLQNWEGEEEQDEERTNHHQNMDTLAPGTHAIGPKKSLISFPHFAEFNSAFWSHRPSTVGGRNSIASMHRVEVLQMEIRRTNPGVIGKAKMNTIKITIALVGIFLACWTPYYVMCIWFWADPDTWAKIDYSVRKFLFLFACTNSCANPIIYGLFTNRKSGTFLTKEPICFLPKSRNSSRWNQNRIDGLEDAIELVDAKKFKSRRDRRSKSFSGSPAKAFIESKKMTAFMRTELHVKTRSFHNNDPKLEESLKRLRKRSLSTPNLTLNPITHVNETKINVITEVHLERNDYTMKISD